MDAEFKFESMKKGWENMKWLQVVTVKMDSKDVILDELDMKIVVMTMV